MAPRICNKELREWCDLRSQPKPVFKPPKIDRGKKARLKKLLPRILVLCEAPAYKEYQEPDYEKIYTINPKTLNYKATKRIKKLAVPKKRGGDEINCKDSTINPRALKYKATTRILKLASPRTHKAPPPRDITYVSPSALTTSASPRVVELAKPSSVYKRPVEPPIVKRGALNAVASARVTELAVPKEKVDHHLNAYAFSVKESALQYNASERITQLAQPKVYASASS